MTNSSGTVGDRDACGVARGEGAGVAFARASRSLTFRARWKGHDGGAGERGTDDRSVGPAGLVR